MIDTTLRAKTPEFPDVNILPLSCLPIADSRIGDISKKKKKKKKKKREKKKKHKSNKPNKQTKQHK